MLKVVPVNWSFGISFKALSYGEYAFCCSWCSKFLDQCLNRSQVHIIKITLRSKLVQSSELSPNEQNIKKWVQKKKILIFISELSNQCNNCVFHHLYILAVHQL